MSEEGTSPAPDPNAAEEHTPRPKRGLFRAAIRMLKDLWSRSTLVRIAGEHIPDSEAALFFPDQSLHQRLSPASQGKVRQAAAAWSQKLNEARRALKPQRELDKLESAMKSAVRAEIEKDEYFYGTAPFWKEHRVWDLFLRFWLPLLWLVEVGYSVSTTRYAAEFSLNLFRHQMLWRLWGLLFALVLNYVVGRIADLSPPRKADGHPRLTWALLAGLVVLGGIAALLARNNLLHRYQSVRTLWTLGLQVMLLAQTSWINLNLILWCLVELACCLTLVLCVYYIARWLGRKSPSPVYWGYRSRRFLFSFDWSRVTWKRPAIVAALCFGLAISLFLQDREGFRVFAPVVFLLWLIWKVIGRLQLAPLILATLLAFSLIINVGSDSLALDLVLIPAGCLLGAAVAEILLHRVSANGRSGRLRIVYTLLACVGVLSMWSVAGAVGGRQAETHYERFEHLRASARYPNKRIGVALSGGGYRAALMHAGVLQELEIQGFVPTHISSVSGGSIIAGFYVIGGSPLDFRFAVEYHQVHLWRELLNIQNLLPLIGSAEWPGSHLRLLPSAHFGRVDLQAAELERAFFADRTLEDSAADAPKLMICATDLATGSAVGITQRGVFMHSALRPLNDELFRNRVLGISSRDSSGSTFCPVTTQSKLAKLVAASGAYPLAFEPVRMPCQSKRDLLLTDGGLVDNSGMTMLLEAAQLNSFPKSEDEDWNLDLAISSDGGSIFLQQPASDLEPSLRAVDVISNASGMRAPSAARGKKSRVPPLLLLSPRSYVDNTVPGYSYQHFGFFPSYRKGYSCDPREESCALDEVQQRLVSVLDAYLTRHLPSHLPDSFVADLLQHIYYYRQQNNPTKPLPDLDTFHASLLDLVGKQDYFSWGEDFYSLYDKANDAERANLLKRAVIGDFSMCLETFLNTPTLQDQIDQETASRLFRLGRYLVLLNHDAIDEALQTQVEPPARSGH